MANDKTWDEWTDVLGNTYRTGDLVAIATISGKSPQMVIALVDRINKVNSSGETITSRVWFDHPEPIEKTRACYNRFHLGYSEWRQTGGSLDSKYVHVDGNGHDEHCFPTYLERGEYRPAPSCSVRCIPLKDARGFSRYGKDPEGNNRAVTYSIPNNIIKIELSNDE